MKTSTSKKLHKKNPSLHLKRSIALFTVVWTVIIGMIISLDLWEAQNRLSQDEINNIHAGETVNGNHYHAVRGDYLKYTIIWLVGLLGVSWTLRNIKQRIKLREKLEQSVLENNFNLRQTLNAIGDGLVSINMEGNITELNPVAEKLIGRSADDVVGSPFADIFDLTISQASETMITGSATMDGSGSRVKAQLKDANGHNHTILCALTTLKDAEANPTGSVLVFRDSTKEIQLQEELQKAKQLEAVAILAGGMAHDFNNLFTSLFGNIQLAMMKLDKNHPSYSSLFKATQTFEQGTGLTSRLITFSKGGIPLLEETSLEPILQQSTQFIKKDTISIELKLADDLWPVLGDHRQLSQVFNNLCSNAAEAMDYGGSMQIIAKNSKVMAMENLCGSGDCVMIQVRDDGCGIAPADKDRIFDIFFTTKEQGRGLGLAIVHRIITKHNGFIKLDSELDAGTTFTLYLPAVVDSGVASTLPLAVSVEETIADGLSILVVDDDELIRTFTEELLKASGYQVDTSSNAEAALEKYFLARHEGQPYAAVIMDLFMPGGRTGDIACRELVAGDPKARVIAMSGYFNDTTMAMYRSAGFKGRISKPFNVETLAEELSRVIALE